ncbi:MAG: ABC transporter substrate-binding protein, partial [Pseudorhizobium sp.]
MPKPSIYLITGVSVLAMGVGSALSQETDTLGIPDSEYSLDALIAAAKTEGPITVIDATGKIVTMAENFSKKYGLQATGVKMSGQDQEQVIAREAAAGNVRTDVFNMSNLPSVTSQILPQGYGVSWLAPDLKDKIPVEYQDPAITSNNPWVFAYNTDVHGDTCPVDNLWALTTEEWKGRVAIPDPLLRNETM